MLGRVKTIVPGVVGAVGARVTTPEVIAANAIPDVAGVSTNWILPGVAEVATKYPDGKENVIVLVSLAGSAV